MDAASDDDADAADASGILFIETPDGGTATWLCDMFSDDCPAGEKCQVFDSRGGMSWDSTRCVPISPEPIEPDDVCTFDVLLQVDDCAPGNLCWDPDPVTRVGICKPHCIGSADAPSCADEMLVCNTSKDGPALCLPVCDPIAQDCPVGCACYPFDEDFVCAPDGSGDAGGVLDPCEFLNACDPGLTCVGGASFPDCAGDVGCCTPYCEVGNDAPCAEIAGTSCERWFIEGMAPPGFEQLGVCTVPW